jgi:5-methylcytosine-specific restriction endonuclease McrA
MVIEHIIPLVGGGSSTPDNLCLDCYRRNEFKGSRTEAADPIAGNSPEVAHGAYPDCKLWVDAMGNML